MAVIASRSYHRNNSPKTSLPGTHGFEKSDLMTHRHRYLGIQAASHDMPALDAALKKNTSLGESMTSWRGIDGQDEEKS